MEQLVQSGHWPAFRERPYSKVPAIDSLPHAIFVTAIDTNPLSADPHVVLDRREREFVAGLQVLSTLTDGKTYLCKAPSVAIPGTDQNCVEVVEFAGPHPAGLAGTHMHFLAPVTDARRSWYIGYQDVIAIGHLFLEGEILTERVVAIGGPSASNPRLVRTRLGARLSDLLDGEYDDPLGNSVRVIAGSVLTGRQMSDVQAHLGRYHLQVSLLQEGTEREFLGWLTPGADKFSVSRAFTSALAAPGTLFRMTTSTGGSKRVIVPIGVYEKVFPLDMIAPALLKALVTEDTEYAQQLGCLELDEEDVALCTYVCPGKYNYGSILRENLTRIEIEG